MASDGGRTKGFIQSIKSSSPLIICDTNVCDKSYKKKVAMPSIWTWSKGACHDLFGFEGIQL